MDGDLEQNQHQRIRSELVSRLGITGKAAEDLIEKESFKGLSLHETLFVIKTLTEILHDYYAWLVCENRPAILRPLYIQQLKEHATVLTEAGFGINDVQHLLGIQIEVAYLTGERFRETVNALRELLPDERDFRLVTRKRPQVLQLSADHLRTLKGIRRFDGNAEAYWIHLTLNTELEQRIQQPQRVRQIKPQLLPFIQRLVDLGLTTESAETLAIRFTALYRNQAELRFNDFLEKGWNANEVRVLNENDNNTYWRLHLSSLFTAEQALVDVGFVTEFARSLVTFKPWYTLRNLTKSTAQLSVQTFRELGYDQASLERIALHHPKAIFATAQRIRDWHAEMLSAGKDPLACLPILTRYNPPQHRTQTHAPRLKRKKVGETPPLLPIPDNVPHLKHAPLEDLSLSPIIVVDLLEEKPRIADTLPETILESSTSPSVAQMDEEEENEDEEEEDLDFLKDSHEIPWELRIKKLLCHGDEKAEKRWTKIRERLCWMWVQPTHAPGVLRILLEWMGKHEILSTEDIAFTFLQRIIRTPKLYPILQTPAEHIRTRIAVLRTIVQRDFLDEPELLLMPWESLWHEEIKLRVFELDAMGYRAHKKPFLNMLLEPQLAGPLRKNEDAASFRRRLFRDRVLRYTASR